MNFSKEIVPSFISFIPGDLLFSCAPVNDVLFLITFSGCLFLLNRNATDICILVLYPATLPNFFVIFNVLSADPFQCSGQTIISFANNGSFIFLFPSPVAVVVLLCNFSGEDFQDIVD